MKRTLAILFVMAPTLGLSMPAFGTTLRYNFLNHTAVLDPSTSPSGKVLGYNLASNGKFFVDPARTSAFPPPSQTFFENNSSTIGDNDLTLAGTSAIINLGVLFTPANRPQNLQQLVSNFTGRIYVPSLGGGERQILIAPEPAAAVLTGLCLLGLAASRRRLAPYSKVGMFTREAPRRPARRRAAEPV
jgi:hypothetical protein